MQPDGSGAFEEHDHEYDRVAWFPIEEALRVMTHENSQQRVLDGIKQGKGVQVIMGSVPPSVN